MGSIVLFDGECNLCDASVNFIIANDQKMNFRFASLQSQTAHDLLCKSGRTPQEYGSVVVIDGERIMTFSSAALFIARHLRFPWPLLSVFTVVPQPARDAVYRYIAAHRYRWFGRRETCRIPTAADRERFL